MTLRPYQHDGKAQIYDAWSRVRNALYVLPTGGGKSVVIADIVGDFDRAGRNTATIAHRQELVSQMSLHIARARVPHRIIAPKNVVAFIAGEHRLEFGRSYVSPNARAAVVGIDTLLSRRDELASWAKQIGLWIIDEAHHVLTANKWGAGVTLFGNALGLGVTATPERADGNGVGDLSHDGKGVFGEMIVGPTMRQLIAMGMLTDYEIVIPESDFDIDKLHITGGGDYSPKEMREASRQSHIVGDVVEQYVRWAYGKRGITFATDVETATEIAAKFNATGIPASVVSAKTADHVRSDTIRRFRAGSIWQLVNVDLFGEGFDLPAIEVVSMARPTASLAVFLQQFGRSLRLLPGKTRGLVIDHVSNVKRHGLPDRARMWSLSSRDRRVKKDRDPDEIPVRQCIKCQRGYEATKRVCPYCGHMPVPLGGGRAIEQVDGDLMLLDAEILARMRAAIELPSPALIASQTTYVTGNPAFGRRAAELQLERIREQQELSDTIALWAGYQQALGRSDDESYRRFYFGTGGIDVLSALAMPRIEMEKLRSKIQSWLPSNGGDLPNR